MLKKKALLIDDSEDFQSSFTRLLSSFQYEVTAYSSPLEAINDVENKYFDVAFIDCLLPGLDGFEASKKLSKLLGPDTNIFLISGIIDQSNYASSSKGLSHLSGFLKKPLDVERLKDLLQIKPGVKQQSPYDFYLSSRSTSEIIKRVHHQTEFSGTFEVPFFILQLSANEFSGELLVGSAVNKYTVYFNKGVIYRITSLNFEDSMGELLLLHGYITEDDSSSYLQSDEFKNGTKRLGQALVERNLISPHAVDKILKFQIEARLQSVSKLENPEISIKETANEGSSPFDLTLMESCNIIVNKSSNWSNNPKFIELLKTFKERKFKEGPSLKLVNQDSPLVNLKDNNTKGLSNLESEELLKTYLVFCAQIIIEEESDSSATNNPHQEISGKISYLTSVLKSGNPYAIFEISNPEKITDSEIAKKYHSFAKDIHPDKLDQLKESKEVKDKAHFLFTELTNHFNSIKTLDNRKSLKERKKKDEAEKVLRINKLFEEAKTLLLKGSFPEAHDLFMRSELNDADIKHLDVYKIWAVLKTGSQISSLTETEETLRSQEHQKHIPEVVNYVRALFEKRNSNLSLSLKLLQDALNAEPNFLPARRELAQLKNSALENSKSPQGKSSFLSGLFKNKKGA